MTLAGMDADQALDPAQALRKANLSALRAVLPTTHKDIESSIGLGGWAAAIGRNGERTFQTSDPSNEKCWLGRVTMPRIAAEALVEAFEPGDGNALIVGFGHGTEARLLLDRMRPHQAIFVVEPETSALGAALSLHDFSGAIRNQRLLLFSGDRAWDCLERFLIESVGFLAPDRILAWPWFDKRDHHKISARLCALQSTVARERLAIAGPTMVAADIEPRIWDHSNSTNERAHRWARRFESAARACEVPVGCCAFDSPCMMNPLAVKRQMDALRPTISIGFDSLPPNGPVTDQARKTAIIVTHPAPLAETWIDEVPRDALLFVQTDSQRMQAIASGFSEPLVIVLPPGAHEKAVRTYDDPVGTNGMVVVLADCIRASASDVGLHLASHKRLWDAASGWIKKNIETYTDGDADRALQYAQEIVGIRIKDEKVQEGLADRVRRYLGPQLVNTSIIRSLVNGGLDVRIVGHGWPSDKEFAEIGIRPDAIDTLRSAVALIVPSTSGWFDDRAMDWLASGRPVLLRKSDARNPSGLQNELSAGITGFSSIEELSSIAERCAAGSAEVIRRAANAAQIVHAKHTWRHRLTTVLGTVSDRPT